MSETSEITWWWDADADKGHGEFVGLYNTWVTVAYVRHAEEGEAEGGLIALARFMIASLRPNIKQAPLSPAGWYYVATTEERGRWEKSGPYDSPELARNACTEAFRVGKYLAAAA